MNCSLNSGHRTTLIISNKTASCKNRTTSFNGKQTAFRVKGEPLPAEMNEKMKRLAELARYYPDPERDVAYWMGTTLV